MTARDPLFDLGELTPERAQKIVAGQRAAVLDGTWTDRGGLPAEYTADPTHVLSVAIWRRLEQVVGTDQADRHDLAVAMLWAVLAHRHPEQLSRSQLEHVTAGWSAAFPG